MGWFLPTLAYLLLVGIMGITVKIALQELQWPIILVWTTIVYAAVALVTWASGAVSFQFPVRGTLFAILSGVGACLGFVFLNIALNRGDTSQVVPASSAYPLVTSILAVTILRESLSGARIVGILLLVSGLIVLGRAG